MAELVNEWALSKPMQGGGLMAWILELAHKIVIAKGDLQLLAVQEAGFKDYEDWYITCCETIYNYYESGSQY